MLCPVLWKRRISYAQLWKNNRRRRKTSQNDSIAHLSQQLQASPHYSGVIGSTDRQYREGGGTKSYRFRDRINTAMLTGTEHKSSPHLISMMGSPRGTPLSYEQAACGRADRFLLQELKSGCNYKSKMFQDAWYRPYFRPAFSDGSSRDRIPSEERADILPFGHQAGSRSVLPACVHRYQTPPCGGQRLHSINLIPRAAYSAASLPTWIGLHRLL
jgi:hypothetical protein